MYESVVNDAVSVRRKTHDSWGGAHDEVAIAYHLDHTLDKARESGLYLMVLILRRCDSKSQQGEIMETRVKSGQASEDRVTGTIERWTSMAPSSLFLDSHLAQWSYPQF